MPPQIYILKNKQSYTGANQCRQNPKAPGGKAVVSVTLSYLFNYLYLVRDTIVDVFLNGFRIVQNPILKYRIVNYNSIPL